ncbi:reverse transcriptase [Aphelenchoides avenae]|nr:reverse transcriptase [Aphelenchus avenae]
MGDFNARVGPNEPDELYIGRHSAERRNDAGTRLAAFAEAQKLYVANSLFEKPLSKRWTWQSSDLVTKSELDYVLYGDRRSIENLEVLSQFHARSDHRLVRATIRVDMRKIRKEAFFKRPRRPAELDKAKFQRLVNEADWSGQGGGRTMEQYESLQETLTTCAKNAGTRKESTRKLWKTPETTELLKQLQQAKAREDSEEAKRLSKLCRTKVAEDYENYRNSRLLQTAEKRKSLKKCRRDMTQSQLITGALVDENGQLQTERDAVEEICRNFYTKLFESKVVVPRQRRAEPRTEPEVPPITADEVEAALVTMKNGKAPGPDGVRAEMLKAGGPTLWKQLARMFTRCVRKKKIPPQWKESTTVLLYKKGDAKNLKNYRPICLLSVVYKLFTKVLTRRITEDLDRAQPVEQAGFRQGYCTLDHLQTVNQIQEKAREKGLRQYLVFVDYEKAFDTVETNAVLNALEAQGVHRLYIDVLEDIYEDGETLITLFDKPIRIPIRRGVRQGDTISPKLFTAALEMIFRELRWDERRNAGITIDGRHLTHLRFADDIVLIGNSRADVQRRLEELNEKSGAVGLRINKDKTEWFEYFETSEKIYLEGEEIRRARSYVYLGQQLSEDHSANMNGEIGRRQKAAWLSFKNIQEVLKKISDPKLRANLFNTTVLPALLYGCETWTLTKRHEEKLSVTERAMERRVLGLTMWDQERNEAVREKTGFIDAVAEARKRKLRWAGHVARRDDGRWTKAATTWKPKKKAPNKWGKPTRWEKSVCESIGEDWLNAAQDREEYRNRIRRATTTSPLRRASD